MGMPKILISDREKALEVKHRIVEGILDAGLAEIPDDLLDCDSGIRDAVAPAIIDAHRAVDALRNCHPKSQ